MTATVEIEIAELKAEVKTLLLAIERDKVTPKPVQRIGEIIEAMRSYKMAIVKANLPRNVGSDRLKWGRTITLLRQHREEHLVNAHPTTGIEPLRDWLKKLDCAFVLGGRLDWRLNDSDWEASVWTQLCEWVERGYAMLFSDTHKAEWPRVVDADVLAKWEDEEQELEYRLFARMGIFLPQDDSPVLDENQPFTIRWRESALYLGDTDRCSATASPLRSIAHVAKDSINAGMRWRSFRIEKRPSLGPSPR